MEHYYLERENPNGFNYENLFIEFVNRFDNAHFVEIGIATGTSAAFMGIEIYNSGKNIKFDAIDCFHKYHIKDTDIHPTTLELLSNERIDIVTTNEQEDGGFDSFKEFIKPVNNIVNPIREYSVIQSIKYENESLDMVFIDGNHSYDEVIMDINYWLPKVKQNGILAGHDYTDENSAVRDAVDSIFPKNKIRIDGWCWIIEKSNLV